MVTVDRTQLLEAGGVAATCGGKAVAHLHEPFCQRPRLEHGIPRFPDFKPLEYTDRPGLERFTRNHPPYSDYNFMSLWSWSMEDDVGLCEDNGVLVLRLRDYSTRETFFSIFGNQGADDTAEKVIRFARANSLCDVLRLVPEHTAEWLRSSEALLISEDRDNDDYILSIESDSPFPTHSVRRRARRFHEQYQGRAEFRLLGLRDAATKSQIFQVFERWSLTKDLDAAGWVAAGNELRAVSRLLESEDAANLRAIGVFIDGRLSGFSIDELLPDGYAMGHFAKADRNLAGVFQAIELECVRTLRDKGVSHWNIEQDLGIRGLRHSKTELKPVAFLRKYKVELR